MGEEDQRISRALTVRGGAPLFQGIRGGESSYQGLWFTLFRMQWRSLVLVPVDPDGSTAGVATSLANVARRLRQIPVTFLVVTHSIDYASAGRFVSSVSEQSAEAEEKDRRAARVIVSMPPVVTEPLGLTVTGAADAVALYIRKGQSRMRLANKTVRLVGRDRIIGCIVD